MAVTQKDLKERMIERLDPDEILEYLDISSEALVEAFGDRLNGHYRETLIRELFSEEEESEEETDI